MLRDLSRRLIVVRCGPMSRASTAWRAKTSAKPPRHGLRKAHQALDRAVGRLFRRAPLGAERRAKAKMPRRRRGSRTLVIATLASARPRVTVKKKRKAETAAFIEVAEAPPDLM